MQHDEHVISAMEAVVNHTNKKHYKNYLLLVTTSLLLTNHTKEQTASKLQEIFINTLQEM
jgi:hypothetical protein